MGVLVTMKRQSEMKEGHGCPGLHTLMGVRWTKHLFIVIPLFPGPYWDILEEPWVFLHQILPLVFKNTLLINSMATKIINLLEFKPKTEHTMIWKLFLKSCHLDTAEMIGITSEKFYLYWK